MPFVSPTTQPRGFSAIPTYANKAVLAFVLAFFTSLLAQVQDKTEFGDLTTLQWLVAVVSAIVTAGAVYAIPNRSSEEH